MGGGEMTNCNKNVILNKYLEKILNIFSSDHCWDDCYAVNLIPLNNDEENFCIMQPWFFFCFYIFGALFASATTTTTIERCN